MFFFFGGGEEYWPDVGPLRQKLVANNKITIKYYTVVSDGVHIQGVQLKSGKNFNMNNLFTKIYNTLYYTTKLYLH